MCNKKKVPLYTADIENTRYVETLSTMPQQTFYVS